MMQVVLAGTGRRAQLDNIEVAGKTGTTNGYKDAWFIGYTGNYVGAVWFGNDDDTPMEKMTGGTLPAATWHDVMEYAHQGIELKPLPGRPAPTAAARASACPAPVTPKRRGGRPVCRRTRRRHSPPIEAAMTDMQKRARRGGYCGEFRRRNGTGRLHDGGQAFGRGRWMSLGTAIAMKKSFWASRP